MHIIEAYALTCGLKIDKPYVYENYSPVPWNKFISFSKKNYPYYLEVIELIKPELKARGIDIVQLRANQDQFEVENVVPNGPTFGQWAYIIKHSMLHFGEDDFIFDLAGHYDVPRVILFSHTYPNTTKPYWGSEDKQKILFDTGPNQKPTFSLDPNQNFIKSIKPEKIASAIMELLGIPWTPPYETLYIGNLYRPQHDIIEISPSKNNINLVGKVSTIAIRLDYEFDEQFLQHALQQTRATVVTNKPIQIGVLQSFKANIQEVIYLIDENSDVQFARELGKLNLPYAVISLSTDEEFQKQKIKFFDSCPLSYVPIPDIRKIKELENGLKGLYYKSGKRIITGAEEYKGRYDMLNNRPSSPDDLIPCPEEPQRDFMKDLDLFYIVKKLDQNLKA